MHIYYAYYYTLVHDFKLPLGVCGNTHVNKEASIYCVYIYIFVSVYLWYNVHRFVFKSMSYV